VRHNGNTYRDLVYCPVKLTKRSKPRGLFIREAFGCLLTYGPKTSLVVSSSNLLVMYLMNLDFTRKLGG
jgi:hypothetical protein